MKAKTIYYKKLFDLGNFQHEEIGSEVEVENTEKAADVLEKAMLFVRTKGNPANSANSEEYKRYKSIVESPDNYTVKEHREAKEFLEKNNPEEEIVF
jgi:hypothetical protein